jgi:ankyrin repeat protein
MTGGLPLGLRNDKSRRLSLLENKHANKGEHANRVIRRIQERISEGETDLVFEYFEAGHSARSKDSGSVSLIQWFAYYGDVSAIKFLLRRGESLGSLGENVDLNGAVFGSEQSIQMLLDAGAFLDAKDMNGDSPLTWASWHLRPRSMLRLLCYGEYRA